MIMRLLAIIFLYFLLSAKTVSAQSKSITDLKQVWLGYNNQTRLSDKWGLWGDFHLRTKDDYLSDLSTTIARVGVMYYVNDATKLTAGYAYVTSYPVEGTLRVNQPEHRPWQQVQWHTQYAKTRMMQWIRLEERFRRKIDNDSTLGIGHNFNLKLRYNLYYEVPFANNTKPAGKWSFIIKR